MINQPKQEKQEDNLNAYTNAERYYQQTLSIPLYPELTDKDIEFVSDTIIKIIGNN